MTGSSGLAIAVAAFLLAPCALCLDIHDLKGGTSQVTALLDPPGFSDRVNLTLPAECFVLGATVNATGLPSLSDPMAYPHNVTLSLDGTVLWAFRGCGYGELGRQAAFSDNTQSFTARFGQPGGSARASVKLPLGAKVAAASLELDCTGPERRVQLAAITGTAYGGQLGSSVTPAGDFNADGLGDVLVGSQTDPTGGPNAGRAFLFFGGPAMDTVPDLTFTGGAGDLFGCSVTDAGDLNGDGYDDIAIGASRCSAVANEAGRVLVYFGGKNPDAVADVLLNGSCNERFGASIGGPGDFNGDGFDDLAVGADASNLTGDPGRAYLFYGGARMDSAPDLRLNGEAAGDYFGLPVSETGDLNGDGFDDLAVGAILNDAGASNAGRAYVFFGGPDPDGAPDVVLDGSFPNGWFGYSISGAGDFNGDGFDDLVVGAPCDDSGGPNSGAAYVHLGGPSLDDRVDLTIVGAASDWLGLSVSGAGDVNGDGLGDIIAGAPFNATAGAGAGAAFVYFGGGSGKIPDMTLLGGTGESMGSPVSGAGNVNGDGLDDLLLGEPYCDIGGTNAGRVLVLSQGDFVTGPGLRIGDEAVWDPRAEFAGKKAVQGLAGALDRYLATAGGSGPDGYGNLLAEIPLELSFGGEGEMKAGALDIRYDWGAPVRDFSTGLNRFIAVHGGERDGSGNLTIPLAIRSDSQGRVNLSGLNLSIDEAPFWTENVPAILLDEDTAEPRLLDLWAHFRDDHDPPGSLSFDVVSVDPPGIVELGISDGRYLSADALTGGANDNWTGALSAVVSGSDRRGLSRLSDPFVITVVNVNDPPAVTSLPVTEALTGLDYEYRITATDAEDFGISFTLGGGPVGMELDLSSGVLRWRPAEPGSFPVSVVVSDGKASSFHNFTVIVSVLNKPPRFVSVPPAFATAGVPFHYEARAVDQNGDSLEYSLLAWPGGMVIGRFDGSINWTPPRELSGNLSVAFKVSDGKGGEARQEFELSVQPFVRPRVGITAPVPGKTISGKYLFAGAALKGTLDVVAVQVRLDSGQWRDATGNATWGFSLDTGTLRNGQHTLEARASDGTTFSDVAGVRFGIDNGTPGREPSFVLLSGTVLITIAIVGAAVVLHLRRMPRRSKRYDWGPD